MLSEIESASPMRLTGILACTSAIIIGCIALFTSIPSLGRQDLYDFLLSPAAGGILFIMLGLAGVVGVSLGTGRQRILRIAIILSCLFAVTAILTLAIFGEWTAFVLTIIIEMATSAAAKAKKSALLFLFAGLAGFPIGQLAITTIPYGWKVWVIPGVLFIISSLIILCNRCLNHLPLLHSEDETRKRQGRIFYAVLSLMAILLTMAFLIDTTNEPMVVTASAIDNWNTRSLSKNDIPTQPLRQSECDCRNKTSSKADVADQERQEGVLTALIRSPEDVRTYPHQEQIRFEAEACGKEPLKYLWTSSRDGIIGMNESFGTSNLSTGWHKITLIVSDANGTIEKDEIELGIADRRICSKVSPRPKYYPVDTPCQDVWPNATKECQELEVCHPGLDYIVTDAVNCCDGSPIPGSDCSYACNNSGGDKKKCRGLYIIRAFGPEARYMKDYALFKACCSGYPECTRTCIANLAGTCAFRKGFNENVSDLSCRPEEWGIEAWRSDQDMEQNSAVLGLFPTHATVNILKTGVCIDYSAALTTAMRKAGYNKTEALSTSSTGYDLPVLGNHPGHAYNLVLLPGDSKYHIIDTTGNGEGINLGGVPHYFRFTGCFAGMPVQIRVFDWWVGYCSKTAEYSYNDAGDTRSPEREEIFGCP